MPAPGHVGLWPRHWGILAFPLFPIWGCYLLLLFSTLLLSRFLTRIFPGRRWRDPIDDRVSLGGAILL
jgi:hypothetical protein